MFLVVILILALVLTVQRPLYPLLDGALHTTTAVAVATLLPAVVAWFGARRALQLMERYPARPSLGQAHFGWGLIAAQTALALAHAAVFLCTDWAVLCRQVPKVGGWILLPGLLSLVPFLLSVLLVWIVSYPADRAVRHIAVELYLLRGRPLRPVWPLREYVVFNLRHSVLFVLLPMLLILAAHDAIVLYARPIRAWTGLAYAPDLLIGVAAILVAVVAPEILRHVWVTQRLPDGPLRDRLERLATKLRLRYREILVWRSGGMLVNAAVMGVVPPLRYVLITDGMLEQMDDTKIEAVFGHEAGHVKRSHILYFLLFAFISGCAVTIFAAQTQGMSVSSDPAVFQRYQILVTIAGALLLLKWVFFGWISRRFERHADIYGARTLAVGGLPCGQPCHLHTSALPGQCPPGDPLCATAAHIFSDALHEVAVLNSIPPESPSFRHGSIASRARFLVHLAQDPLATQSFERLILVIKAGILAAALVGGVWAAHELDIWRSLAERFAPQWLG
ncbi:MAG: M48 family metalloprotease [Phycisphaerales bacterium]|nr:M48 family metalloprotease [Phycisphaerales bacterium]